MDNETDDMSETAGEISSPRGCEACVMGVELGEDLTIGACVHCSHTTRGHRTDHEAAGLVFEALAALADIRKLLWPIGDPNASWSPDTIDQVARRLEFLRTGPNYPAADAVRYSGSVRIELSYGDSDGCYDGKVIVDGHTYSVSVGPPAIGYGPGIAFDSADAYDRAAHAALSFAAADLDWGDGCDIFTPAADIGPNGWIIRRHASFNHR
jgi:hypothetical protein